MQIRFATQLAEAKARENDALFDLRTKHAEQISELTTGSAKVTERFNDLWARRDEGLSERAKMRELHLSQLAAAQAQLDSTLGNLTAAHAQHHAAQLQHNASRTKQLQELDAATLALSALQAQNADLQTQYDALQTQYTVAQSALSAAKAQLAVLASVPAAAVPAPPLPVHVAAAVAAAAPAPSLLPSVAGLSSRVMVAIEAFSKPTSKLGGRALPSKEVAFMMQLVLVRKTGHPSRADKVQIAKVFGLTFLQVSPLCAGV